MKDGVHRSNLKKKRTETDRQKCEYYSGMLPAGYKTYMHKDNRKMSKHST